MKPQQAWTFRPNSACLFAMLSLYTPVLLKGGLPVESILQNESSDQSSPPWVDARAEVPGASTMSNEYGIAWPTPEQLRGGCVPLNCAGDEDVSCAALNVDDTARRAVGHMEFFGSGEDCGQGPLNGNKGCTGVLLRDTDNNTGAAYFLTAGHCICTASLANTLEVRWDYQTAFCNGPDPNPGPQFTTGFELLKFHKPGDGGSLRDFALLRLKDDPNPITGPSLAPWSAVTPSNLDPVKTIHHPCSSYKRLAQGHVESHCGAAASITFVEWDQGITENGSSGAPLFNASWEVVGSDSGPCPGEYTCAERSTHSSGFSRFASTLASSEGFGSATVQQILDYVPPDPLEPNDTFGTAAFLAQTANHNHVMKLVDFEDYFRVTLCAQHNLDVSVTNFSSMHLNGGPLTLKLLRANQSEVDSDSATSGSLSVSGTNLVAGDYYIRVFRTTGGGFFLNGDGAAIRTGEYTLNITVAGVDDCNDNGIPDDCESALDCDNNSNPDICDLYEEPLADCDDNGILDECETARTPDCNHNCVKDTDEDLSRLYVNASATGLNDGTSWTNAFVRLQDALMTATCTPPGTVNEIWAAEGTYKPTARSCTRSVECGGPLDVCIAGVCDWDQPRQQTFQLINGVALYGGFNGGETSLFDRDPQLNTTTLSGDVLGDDTPTTSTCCAAQPNSGCDTPACETVICNSNPNCCSAIWDITCALQARLACDDSICFAGIAEDSYHVVTGSGTDATAVLDGFTIMAGNANADPPNSDGAGMDNEVGSPTLNHCKFWRNSARDYGGGISNTSDSNPIISNCEFRENYADGFGGGMFNMLNSPTVTHCTFSKNYAYMAGGMYNESADSVVTDCTFSGNASFVYGGGMRNYASSPRITNCTFIRNTALSGGGIYNLAGTSATVINCTFNGNATRGSGGGIYNFESNSTVFGCSFSGNSVQENGGGMRNNDSSSTVTNCTFSVNTAASGGGIYDGDNSSSIVANCVLWGNSDSGGSDESAQLHVDVSTPTVSYSILQGGWSGAGGNNLSSDPLFYDVDGADGVVGTIDDNLRLRAGSPAFDAGNDASVPADTPDLDGDLNVAEPIPYDLAGNARFVGTVDMGAYEYIPDCNNNAISDDCDISCGIPSGPCDVPGCGQSEDCDASAGWPANGIPDECDIADCPDGNTNCDDCNLNGVPDRCDIVSLTSQDANSDLIPDECASFVAACSEPGEELFWTCVDNWLLGGLYPDDAGSAMGIAVTLPAGAVVFLNETVLIPSLRLAPGSELRITQTGAEGDLTFSSPAILDVEGTILISNSRKIGDPGLPPTVVIGPDGVYEADAAAVAAGTVSATLRASSLSVVGNDCFIDPCPHGGEVILTDSMSITTTGDLIIDGLLANGECEWHREGRTAARSYHTPPSIRLPSTSGSITVGGTMVMSGAAGLLHASLQPIQVAGDWQNHSVRHDCFEADAGTIRMNGTSPTPQTFEVAATDTGGTGGSSDDFRIGTLQIATNAQVTLVDDFDNDLQGEASCGEAQYVDTLVLEAGATLTAINCRLYYETIVGDPSQIVTDGCGEVRPAANPDPLIADPTDLKKSRAISFVPPTGSAGASPSQRALNFGGGANSAIRVVLTSLHRVDPPYNLEPSIPFVSHEGQVRWVGPPTQYAESTSNATPFKASSLQCTPHYQDWSTVGLLHVFGSAIVPSSNYRVQTVASSCQGMEERCTAVSEPLVVSTTRWGDVTALYNPPSDTTQPDVGDIAALVSKFRSLANAPIKARALLAGDDANGNINSFGVDLGFTHIAACVDAFRGKAYPYTIAACP